MATKSEKKVVIVGASSAGLFAAYLLAKEGHQVKVFEKSFQIGLPRRTLIVTNKFQEFLGIESEEVTINKIKYMKLSSNGKSVTIELKPPDLVIEREKLINLLAKKAEKEGAKIFPNREVISLNYNNQNPRRDEKKEQDGRSHKFDAKLIVKFRNLQTGEIEEYFSDYLIGADGCHSVIRRIIANKKINGQREGWNLSDGQYEQMEEFNCETWQQIKPNSFEMKAIFQIRVTWEKLKEVYFDPQVCEVWFEPEKTKYFFWLIPESAKIVTIGSIADSMAESKKILTNFLKEKRFNNDNIQVIEEQAGLVPFPTSTKWFKLKSKDNFCNYYEFSNQDKIKDYVTFRKKIFLVGDAAGEVKASTFGGVVSGLRGAKAVAETILGISSGMREYNRLNRELLLHYRLRQILNYFRAKEYKKLLSYLEKNIGVKRILSSYNRDEFSQALPLILRRNIFFILMALRIVARAMIKLLFVKYRIIN
ncbi:MAG: NAD(P)/FAD-dependent oxidoreductase [Candidatus Aminicenantes bacterium]|nr:NAD(P)/FAD-dependent oxidoreductase [Candidatus Aminicenantes bacterium]